MDKLFLAERVLFFIFVTLNLKSTSWRLLSCSIVLALCAADMMVACTGSKMADYSFGAILGTGVLQSVRFLLLVRPMEEYRHESDKVPAYELPFMQRFFWSLNVVYSPRAIGWSFMAENSVVPVEPRHQTRASFIASRLRWLLSHYLLLDVATLYMRCNPVLSSRASIASQGYIMQCLNVAVACCQYYAMLTCMHCAAAVLAVGLNLSKPQAWPQLFGRWKDAYTIRKFWGKVWHQMLRYNLTLFGPHRPKPNPWDPTLLCLRLLRLRARLWRCRTAAWNMEESLIYWRFRGNGCPQRDRLFCPILASAAGGSTRRGCCNGSGEAYGPEGGGRRGRPHDTDRSSGQSHVWCAACTVIVSVVSRRNGVIDHNEPVSYIELPLFQGVYDILAFTSK
ncbi:hypothetical protein EV401DRAFT_1407107 [Pisolithus croceorrhizus]|nr:hypothetical protein EV401DRAFT_1407107 [Pisolithus croceorrhizus]